MPVTIVSWPATLVLSGGARCAVLGSAPSRTVGAKPLISFELLIFGKGRGGPPDLTKIEGLLTHRYGRCNNAPGRDCVRIHRTAPKACKGLFGWGPCAVSGDVQAKSAILAPWMR